MVVTFPCVSKRAQFDFEKRIMVLVLPGPSPKSMERKFEGNAPDFGNVNVFSHRSNPLFVFGSWFACAPTLAVWSDVGRSGRFRVPQERARVLVRGEHRVVPVLLEHFKKRESE